MNEGPLRVALAEDEPPNLRRLARLLKEAGCDVVATFTSGHAVLKWVQARPDIDALFLDIRMPGPSGLDVLRSLPDPIPVVFVTAFSNHAVEAFEGEALDYLLKPVTSERLERCLARLRRRMIDSAPTPASPSIAAAHRPNRYPVKAGEGLVFLDLTKTTHFEVEDEVVFAHAGGRFETGWKSLSEVEGAFPEAGLLRIHRHLLIRPEIVVGVRPCWGARLKVTLPGGIELESSRGGATKLKDYLGVG
ncbi:MAG: response regulator transcription factor [Acidobacteria bacterium]|nr:response regulator transcription factor [Acidobacteriota bacterium]MBI3486654.1 response regulator transcription factor [Acidobacteriota bacterium]